MPSACDIVHGNHLQSHQKGLQGGTTGIDFWIMLTRWHRPQDARWKCKAGPCKQHGAGGGRPREDHRSEQILQAALMQAGQAQGRRAHLEQETVAGADGEGRDLRQSVGARLKDDQQHANGRRHLLQHQALCDLQPALHLRPDNPASVQKATFQSLSFGIQGRHGWLLKRRFPASGDHTCKTLFLIHGTRLLPFCLSVQCTTEFRSAPRGDGMQTFIKRQTGPSCALHSQAKSNAELKRYCPVDAQICPPSAEIQRLQSGGPHRTHHL